MTEAVIQKEAIAELFLEVLSTNAQGIDGASENLEVWKGKSSPAKITGPTTASSKLRRDRRRH